MAQDFRHHVWKILEPAVEYLFPAVCVHCRDHKRIDEYLCTECHQKAFGGNGEPIYPKEGILCLFRLNDVIRTLIHGLKYQGLKGVPSYLVRHASAELWESPILQKIGRWVWIPVPLHPARMRERGYNQAEIFARCLQGRVGGGVYSGILRRVRYSKSQTQQDATQRIWNVAGAFVARPPVPYSVMLVDDVFTTGSTTSTCQYALEQSGCQVVRVITLAYEPTGSGKEDWVLDQERWGNRKRD